MDSFLSHTPSGRESSIAATIETASEIPDRQSLPSAESSTSTTPKRKRITTADARGNTLENLRDVQKERFPRLSKMAIDILSIPAMSAEPERTFSGARRTISWDRMLLGASTIEKGECLKSWIRSGITAGLQVDEVEQYEYMAEERSTSALKEDVGP
ncbi:hypothetical protein FOMA001_g17649 [Fusarium oxysporum f. sp. matthiolae]|nr:hypothetical protein FOMA001_g17649 [Fusarium oxysporum f. sp. matthiolae]